MNWATRVPWTAPLQHDQYGALETYVLAADWLGDCATVADWGGSTGFFRYCLPTHCDYTLVDGTEQGYAPMVLADLVQYRQPSDGILLRHVLDNTWDWAAILRNACAAARLRIAVVTFTPDAPCTRLAKVKSGWPVWQFRPADLRQVMGAWLVRDEALKTSHPERIYYLERPDAAAV